MKSISCLLALIACLLFSGCTAIAVRGPVGAAVSDEVVDDILGTWIGERIDSIDSTVVFERVPGSSEGNLFLTPAKNASTQGHAFIHFGTRRKPQHGGPPASVPSKRILCRRKAACVVQ